MILHSIPYSRFELTARGIIIHRNKVLLFRVKKSPWYYFPGGHIEFMESTDQTLAREIKEELGVGIRSSRYIGTIENFFFEHRYWHHVLENAFFVTLASTSGRALEQHEECEWVPLDRFKSMDVRPRALRDQIVKWTHTKRSFWAIERTKRR